jgi:hypothetical protein
MECGSANFNLRVFRLAPVNSCSGAFDFRLHKNKGIQPILNALSSN